MRRREFISLLSSSAVAWPLAVRAQQPAGMRRIGVLMNLAESDSEGQARIAAFREGLARLGWAEGRELQIEYRWFAGDPVRARDYAAELAKMPKELQLHILGEFRGLPQEVMKTDLERFGKLERNGKILHRFRLGDYRLYFERHELGIVVHRILSRNSLKDFLFRSSLPTGEDEALQENPKFWELIEAAKASPK